MTSVAPLAGVIGVAAALAAVLACFGWASRRLDALTHAAPLYDFAGAVAILLALVARRPAAAAPGALSCVLAAALVIPELRRLRRRESPAGRGERLRVLQFNLWRANPDPAGTTAWIEETGADVLVLEEATGAGAEVVAQLAGGWPHRAPAEGAPPSSTVILSRRPILESGTLGEIGRHGRRARVFARLEGGITVLGVHLAWPVPAARQARQMSALVEEAARFDPRLMILAGDFNSTPWSFALRALERGLGIARRTRALATWPAGRSFYLPFPLPLPLLAIDHVFAGPGWSAIEVRRGPRLGSDHYPVLVTLERRGEIVSNPPLR